MKNRIRRSGRAEVAAGVYLAACVLLSSVVSAESWAAQDIPNKLEPDFAEAVLAYGDKNYDRTVHLLEEIIKQVPDAVEALELMALTLKQKQDDAKSEEVYEKLIASKTKDNRPPKELAPYHFELGTIQYRRKKFSESKPHFTYAIEHEFNADAAHFFMGLLVFAEQNWKESIRHFDAVLSGDFDDFKPPAAFYLAQCYMRTGYMAGATAKFTRARDLGEQFAKDPERNAEARQVGAQIAEGAAKALAPFDKNTAFGNIAVLTGYDTNVLSLPPTVVDPVQTSGKKSMTATATWGGGYMTSPMKFVQLVPSYRGMFIYNFNSDARSASFLNNMVSVFLNRRPLEPFSYGVKAEAAHTFQNDIDQDTNKGTYRPYSLVLSTGPFVKWEIVQRFFMGFEFTYLRSKNYKDLPTGEARKSGNQYTTKVSVTWDRVSNYFNPNWALGYDINRTLGTEGRSKGIGFDFGNMIPVSQKLRFTTGINVDLVRYPERTPQTRSDKTYSVNLAPTYRFSKNFTVMGTVRYALNRSNIPAAYDYNRFVISTGAAVSF